VPLDVIREILEINTINEYKCGEDAIRENKNESSNFGGISIYLDSNAPSIDFAWKYCGKWEQCFRFVCISKWNQVRFSLIHLLLIKLKTLFPGEYLCYLGNGDVLFYCDGKNIQFQIDQAGYMFPYAGTLIENANFVKLPSI
jgi:hypothetical protein